jgi:CubicO group peptidase (beta-lactamase class C family)
MPRPGRRESVSVSERRIQHAFSLLLTWLERGLTPGVAAVIGRDGRLVGELYAGSAGPERPVESSTLFCLASITKPLTACAALSLLQDGLLALDEPLGDYLPELAPEDRARLSLRVLLTHTSGFQRDLGPEEQERIGPTPSFEQIAGQYGRLRPIVPPGRQVRYSNVNFGLLALLAERLSGRPFPELLRQRVIEPLGLENVLLPPPPEVWDRLADVAGTDSPGAPNEPFNSAWWRNLALPWGGAFGTAREVGRFMTACLADAPIEGFLAPPVLDLMTRPQTNELAGGIPGYGVWPRAEWGLGFELRGEKPLHYFGDVVSPATFGHIGGSGTLAWADPDSGLVCVVLTNRALGDDRPTRLLEFNHFSNAVASSLLD